jgi:RNA polymerase sigma factor (sigma-70 family)
MSPTVGTQSQAYLVFPNTHWSVVLAAGHPDSPQAGAALEQLCRAYWYPLYAFARRLGHDVPEAEDLTQGFFHHLLENRVVSKISPTGGRFRSFLLVAFKNFRIKMQERAQSRKRGGGTILVSMDLQEAETRLGREWASSPTPEAFYDRSWALTTVNQALQRMAAEFSASGRQTLFHALRPFLQGDSHALSYATVAGQLGTTEGTLKVTVNRLRQRYRELLRSTIAQTVTTPAEVEDEMRHLLAALSC